jgi:hypothetical protein
MDRLRQIITRLSGGGTPAIDKALEQHHAQVMADASRHAQAAKLYYGMIAKAKATGNNPTTGKPVTPEELQQWQQQADGAWADYTKIAGKAKAAKPIIAQMGGLLKHVAGGGGGQQSAGQPQAQQGQQTVQPPPQGASASPQPQATVPPPPGAPNPLQQGAAEDADKEAMARQDATGALQTKADIEAQSKIREKQAELEGMSKIKREEKEAEIKAQSTARLAEEEAKHRDKMAEIDEAARVKPPKAASTKGGAAKLPKESSEQVAANKAADLAENDYALAQQRLANPTPVGDTGLVLSWVRSQIRGGGRINNTEIQSLLKSGKLETRFKNAYDRATKGEVDPEFRKQMVDDIGASAKTARATADKYKTPTDPRAKVAPPPDGQKRTIKVTAEDMTNAK